MRKTKIFIDGYSLITLRVRVRVEVEVRVRVRVRVRVIIMKVKYNIILDYIRFKLHISVTIFQSNYNR